MLQALIKRKKFFAICFITILLAEVFAPAPLLALTNGPSQPEFTGFSAVGSSDMVNLFTGDLNYNLPLFELPGPGGSYPFTLSYQSGITMDQESSWVGLGWSLNAGAISRQMRGLPDEFLGDTVTTINDMKPNTTWDFGIEADEELIAMLKEENTPGPFTVGLRLSYNTHMGWDAGYNLGINLAPVNTSGFGFIGKLSTSAIEGATVSAGFSYAGSIKSSSHYLNLGTSFNSRQGLTSLNLGFSSTYKINSSKEDRTLPLWGSGGVSFEVQSFIPSYNLRYIGSTYNASVEIGVLAGLPHLGGRINIGHSSQEIDKRGLPLQYLGYGFLYSRKRNPHQTFLFDLNRTNEGSIHKYTENLAIPATTPDLFIAKGASVNSVFKAYRSDVGIYSDPNIRSDFSSANLGLDANPGAYVDIGPNTGASSASSSTTNWLIQNTDLEHFNFSSDTVNSNHQPFVFRTSGALTSDSLSAYNFFQKDNTVRIDLDGIKIPENTLLQKENGESFSIESGTRSSRKVNSTSINYITNKELKYGSDGLSRKEYTAWIHSPSRVELDRSDYPDHHIAGFEIVNTSGLRYVYALPVKNKEHREYFFSVAKPVVNEMCSTEVSVPSSTPFHLVAGTEEFYQKKELSEYNHSHLLTAVLGPEYVDIDDIPGPSDGDLGFWVRFEYEKQEDYAWRAPYENANYLPGNLMSSRDDKASFMYGKREQYYLKYAETRTHKAEFMCSEKQDGFGARDELNGTTGEVNGMSSRLDSIHLFAKFDAPLDDVKALKRINFTYNQSLCADIPNGNSGKTTLTSIQFSYERSTVGLSTPYEFEYSSVNPSYNTRNQDRWGKYQLRENDCLSQSYSFTRQDSAEANSNAEAWTLKKIILPSGSEISIHYESDQYMHVQNHEAMQLFKIKGFSVGLDSANISSPQGAGPFRVFFDPGTEEPLTQSSQVIPFIKHLHGLHVDSDGVITNSKESQVYFKANMAVLSENKRDYVSGYARIIGYGVESNRPYIELAPFRLSGKDYHPFSAAAWQKMKLEYPHAISIAEFEDDNQSFMEVMGLFAASLFEVSGIFTSFFTTCKDRGIATSIDPDLSFVRLCYPGNGKFGGDSRVREITLDDNWGSTITLGQTYEYTTVDSTGMVVSSGVAENEPFIGYEECPLRYAKLYHKQIPIHTSERLMFEYPVNESYMPQASIGYSKVTVRSKATSLNKEEESGLPDMFSTTGRTVYEFYTAKDFPIQYGETALEKHFPPKPVWNTLFSSLQRQIYSGSQGYSITLNDMHGKPLRITHYGEDKMNRESNHYTTKTEYTYYEGGPNVTNILGIYKYGRTLENEVNALLSYAPDPEDNSNLYVRPMEFGVEREFFTDLRASETKAENMQLGPNLVFSILASIFGIPIPLPGFYANISRSESYTRTAVANKIIRKSGILKQVDVYDGQSHIRTNNLVFDKITGLPVLTSVNNVFDQKLFSFNLPAHYAYNGMGASFDNLRLSFEASFDDDDDCTGWYNMTDVDNAIKDLLRRDDEILLMDSEGEVKEVVIIQDIVNGIYKCSSPGAFETGDYQCLIIRSGSRNLLDQTAMNFTSIRDPLRNIEVDSELSFDIETPTGEVSTSITPVLADSMISAGATTYERVAFIPEIACPEDPIDTLFCADAIIDCDGDCYGKIVLKYINTSGDTMVVDTSECFDCETNNGNEIMVSVGFGYFDPSWTLFLELIPMQSPCTNESEYDSCSTEIASLELELTPCGSRPAPIMGSPEIPLISISNNGGNHWIPKANYVYTDERNLTSLLPATELYLNKEGLVDDVPLFDFTTPFFTRNEVGDKWIETSYNLLIGSSSHIEHSQNAIGVSSSLFRGYSDLMSYSTLGNVPVLASDNALPVELAFEGFEEDSWSLGNVSYGYVTSNFTLSNDMSPTRREKYKVLGGLTGTPTSIVVAKEFDTLDGIPKFIILSLKSESGKDSKIMTCTIYSQESNSTEGFYESFQVPFDLGTRYNILWPSECPSLSELYTGEATLVFEANGGSMIGTRSSNYAHTGSFSLDVSSTEIREQSAINLVGGREYLFEGWVLMADDAHKDLPTYPDTWFVQILENGQPHDVKPIGEIIEGWQQIQCKFTASGAPIFLRFNTTVSQDIYFDDIRLSPVDAAVKSYVYDPNKLRLIAELDENNFATFFHYGEDGRLVLIRKETERGIMTIQESRNHIHFND